MREKLIIYVHDLFRDAADTPKNRDLEAEILQNTLDRYDDLIAQGLGEEAAYAQAVAHIGNVRQLWEQTPPQAPQWKIPSASNTPQPRKRRTGWIVGGTIAVLVVALAVTGGLLFGRTSHRGYGFGGEELVSSNNRQQVTENTELPQQTPPKEQAAPEQERGSIFGTNWIHYGDSQSYTAGNTELDASQVSSLEIHWISGAVTVESYDGSTLSVLDENAQEDNLQLRWRLKNGRLTVQYCAEGFYLTLPRKGLKILVPQTMENLLSVQVDTVSAECQVTGVAMDELEFDSTSGDLTVEADARSVDADTTSGSLTFRGETDLLSMNATSGDLTVEGTVNSLNWDTTSGDFQANGTVRWLDLNTVSGAVRLDLRQTPEELSFDSTSGGVWLAIPGERSFEAELDSVSGRLTCAYPTTQQEDAIYYQAAGSPAELEFDTVSGSVEIVESE